MIRDIGIQLYSLRADAEKDFVEVLKFVAGVGYKAVEPAGFWGMKPKEFKKVIGDLGLKLCSSHSPWARGNNLPEVIDILGELDLKLAVCGFGPDDFKDMDSIRRTADWVNAAGVELARHGITLFQHNHNFEFETLDGRLKYDIYAALAPAVKFQIDAFWAGNFGANDPAAMVKKFAPRMISLHLKDGSFEHDHGKFKMVNGFLDRKLRMMPLGTGEMDIPAIIAATPANISTVIVELDSCIIDMREALKQSYRYLTENRLASGNR